MADYAALTEQHKGKRVFVNGGPETKTVESFDEKDGRTLINFTDGTWEYASLTEPV